MGVDKSRAPFPLEVSIFLHQKLFYPLPPINLLVRRERKRARRLLSAWATSTSSQGLDYA